MAMVSDGWYGDGGEVGIGGRWEWCIDSGGE